MTKDELADAYRRFGILVLRRCSRILRDRGEAEDALQDVFVKLWRHGDAFRQAESQVAWLYRVSDRCCFDRMARRPPLVSEASLIGREAAATGPDMEERDLVFRFLARFDDRLKQVAVLYYVDELTQEEIAQSLGCSRQTVWKKLIQLRERAAARRARG
jgi:RNA polymerase sigma-70 factor (ECF subfamily)